MTWTMERRHRVRRQWPAERESRHTIAEIRVRLRDAFHVMSECYIYSRSFDLSTYLTTKGFHLLTAMALTVTLPDGYYVLC